MRVLALAVVALFLTVPQAQAHQLPSVAHHCRVSDGNGWSNKDVAQGIRCAASKWHVPGGTSKALSVARCESGLDEHNSYAGHDGVYQHDRRYWASRFRHLNPHHGWKLVSSVWNARTNIVISMRMAHNTGWGAWSCA